MSIKAQDQVSKRTLLTGYTTVLIKSVNPGMEELRALGYNYQSEEEPKYWLEGKDLRKVNFYVEGLYNGEAIKTIVQFMLGKPTISQTNKYQFIDKYGKSNGMWFEVDEDNEPIIPAEREFKYNDVTSLRMMYKGEERLTSFLTNFANVRKNKVTGELPEARLDSIETIFSTGDVSEIKTLINSKKQNKVGVYLYVSEDKYQNVYNKSFERGWSTNCDNVLKTLREDIRMGYITGNKNFGDVEGTGKLQLFTPEVNSGKPVGTSTGIEDSLPF